MQVNTSQNWILTQLICLTFLKAYKHIVFSCEWLHSPNHGYVTAFHFSPSYKHPISVLYFSVLIHFLSPLLSPPFHFLSITLLYLNYTENVFNVSAIWRQSIELEWNETVANEASTFSHIIVPRKNSHMPIIACCNQTVWVWCSGKVLSERNYFS